MLRGSMASRTLCFIITSLNKPLSPGIYVYKIKNWMEYLTNRYCIIQYHNLDSEFMNMASRTLFCIITP